MAIITTTVQNWDKLDKSLVEAIKATVDEAMDGYFNTLGTKSYVVYHSPDKTRIIWAFRLNPAYVNVTTVMNTMMYILEEVDRRFKGKDVRRILINEWDDTGFGVFVIEPVD